MKFKECICHDCTVMDVPEGEMYGCGCESAGPIFDAEACGECPQNQKCDVPKNPEQYQN
jgi:hypothetical protein